MEAGRGLISQLSPPSTSHVPRTHLKRNAFSPCPVPDMHGQASWAVTSMPITSVVRFFPASVLLQEQHDDLRPYIFREDRISQVILDRRCMETGALVCQDKDREFNEYLRYLEHRYLYRPGFWYPLPTSYTEEKTSLSDSINSVVNDTNIDAEIEQQHVVKASFNGIIPSEALALAKEALLASREVVNLVESYSMAHVNGFYFPGQGSKNSAKEIVSVEEATVRSKQLLERRSKRRRVPKKTTVISDATAYSISTEMSRKMSKGLNKNDPLRLFLWGPETKQLLTLKEERDLFNKIQDLMRLEEAKQNLQLQFGREPTFSEWAEALGMSCHMLQSCLYSGNRSREKMIYANFRLVVHVAKQYQGMGLNIQDLLQEGSMGLMKSLEKFKPKAGCRFPSYAYWWIRQSIRKAIFQNSRTIRLPENVFALLKKIKNVRKLYIQEGHIPSNEELARRVGITKERLERLLASSRTPVSIQDRVWMDQDVTIQEITADPEVEVPEFTVAKQMMRQHVRNLLHVLPPRERQIIQFRYGIHGEPKSLSDIGSVFGLSKERVRQLESRALDTLKESLTNQGLDAYMDLLI
uniref:RNA polymerase sigma factor rpoD n=1 Tax=Anthurium amnicola TaxID=1678845 RepID=A0A1D1ZHW8_9ARAE